MAAPCPPSAAPTGSPPNVVLVDTLRADHLTVCGYPRPTSPNLARLARESVVFDDACTVMSHTLPAHVSLVTGVHPATHQGRRHSKLNGELTNRRVLDDRLAAITADAPVPVPAVDPETRRRLEELGYIQ